MRKNSLRRLSLCGSTLLSVVALAGCDLAPVQKVPDFVVPASWHGQGPFKDAIPADDHLPTNWWTLFRDPILNGLEEKAIAENADLQASAERFVQARSMVMKARSALLPHLGLDVGASDNKQSEDRLFRSPSTLTQTDEYYNGLATWEPDFWSALRNRLRMRKDLAQQKAADFAAARLSLEAELASDYMILRGYDAQNVIYSQSIAYYQKALETTKIQLDNQAAPRLDLARAQNRLAVTQAEQLDLQAKREVTEHAIAILTNTSPSAFHIEPVEHMTVTRVDVPLGVPSAVLQRRPDIAAAERQMSQANREIGIARAAFYPNISLRANGGFDADGFDLASLANSMWSYGASMTMPIFDGGMRRAELQRSWSEYREIRDTYRSTVLSAFREVEDGLSRTRLLEAEIHKLNEAVQSAEQMQDMTMTLYKGGLSNYLDAIVAQQATLDARIAQVRVEADYLQAEVGLVRAAGGGWNNTMLPTPDQTMSFGLFQYDGLRHPEPTGGIDVPTSSEKSENLTRAVTPVTH